MNVKSIESKSLTSVTRKVLSLIGIDSISYFSVFLGFAMTHCFRLMRVELIRIDLCYLRFDTLLFL